MLFGLRYTTQTCRNGRAQCRPRAKSLIDEIDLDAAENVIFAAAAGFVPGIRTNENDDSQDNLPRTQP